MCRIIPIKYAIAHRILINVTGIRGPYSRRASKIRCASVRSFVLSVRPSRFFWTVFGTSKYAKLLGNTQKDGPKRDPKVDKWGQIQEMSDFGTLKMQNC
mgnify:CR=1 FL=1